MSKLNRKSDLETTYTKGQSRKDLFFGDFFVYNAIRGGSQIICVEKLFNEEETVKREIEAKKKRILNKQDYLVNLLDYSVEEQRNWCSTFYLLKCFYEYVDRNLIGEILERKKLADNKSSFKMEELTHLMYQQVHANAFLQERGIAHGDISPNTIFVSPKNEYKLAFRMNDTMAPERIQVDKAIKNEPLYLAPALYEAVKQRTLEKLKHNQHKSDMFALGLTILQAGLMKGIQDIYVGDRFNARKLEEFLVEFEAKYEDNPLLYTSVRKMCEVNEDERPDFISLKSALPEYDEIKDYFQKVEAGIYEEEPEDEQGTTDSMKDGLNYNYNADQWTAQNAQGNEFQAFDDSQGGYQNPRYVQGQTAYANPGVANNANMNFNKSISNKLSSSSNQGSQNNSFNKQAGFGGDFEAQYNQQGGNWNAPQNTTNLKQGAPMVDAKGAVPQGSYGQAGQQQNLAPKVNAVNSVPQQTAYAAPAYNAPAQQGYSQQGYQQTAPQPQAQQQQAYNPPQQTFTPAPVQAQPVYSQAPTQQTYTPVPAQPAVQNNPLPPTNDDFFSGDFFDYKPETTVSSGFNSYTYSNTTAEKLTNLGDKSVAYSTPQSSYQAPQPTYQAPQPAYQAPQPSYQAPQYQQPSFQNNVAKAPEKHFADQNIHYQETDGYYFPEVDEPAPAPAQTYQAPQQVKVNQAAPSYVTNVAAPQQVSNAGYQVAQSTPSAYTNSQPSNTYQQYQAPQPSYQTQAANTYSKPYAAQSDLSTQQKVSVPRTGGNNFTGNTKVFDGKLYNEVREEMTVVENGVQVKKTIIRYTPADSPQVAPRPVVQAQAAPTYYPATYSTAQPTVIQYR